MERELQIRIHTDRTQAKAAIAEELRDLEKVRNEHREAARERGRLMKQLAADQMATSKQTAADQIAAIRQAGAEQVAATNRQTAAHKLHQQEWRETFRIAREQDRLTHEQMRHSLRAIRGELRAMNAERAAGAAEAGREAAGFKKTEESARGAFSAVKSFAGQMLGLSAGQTVLRAITDEFERVRDAAIAASRETLDRRGGVRELAALRGQAGDTTATQRDVFQFRRQTLQTQEEAIAFQLAALGAGESAIGRTVGAQDFERFMADAGAFSTMIGADAGTMGTLAGNLPSLISKDGRQVSAAELSGRMRQLESIFKPGAGTYSQLTNQLLESSSFSKTGVYRDVADQAALLSFFSLTNAGGAGTMVEQFTRATAGGLGRMRGSPLMTGIGSEEVQKQAEFLNSIGATEQMDPIEIGTRIAHAMRAEQAANPNFNAFTYLQSKGYANIEDIQTLMAFSGGLETFQQAFQPLARAPIDMTGGAMADVGRFQGLDPFALDRRRALAEEQATFTAGSGRGELADVMRREAFARLKARGEADGTYEDWTKGTFGAVRSQQVDREAIAELNRNLPAERQIQGPGPQNAFTNERGPVGWLYQTTKSYFAEPARRDAIGAGAEAAILEGGAIPGNASTGEAADAAAGNLQRLRELAENAAARDQAAPPLRRPPVPAGPAR